MTSLCPALSPCQVVTAAGSAGVSVEALQLRRESRPGDPPDDSSRIVCAMPEPRTDGEQEPAPQDAGGGSQGRLRIVLPLVLVGVFAAIVIVLATGLVTTQGSVRVVASPPSGAPSASPGVPTASSVAPNAPPGASAALLIAVVDDSGALATMDERGGSRVSYAVPGVVFGSPVWSPDGSRIAAVGSTPDDTSIYVFTVLRGGSGGHAKPVVIIAARTVPRSISTGRQTARGSPSSRPSQSGSRCGLRPPMAARPSTGAARARSSAGARRCTSTGRARIGCSCTSAPGRAGSSERSAWTVPPSHPPSPGPVTSARPARAGTVDISPTCVPGRIRPARSSSRRAMVRANTICRSSALPPSSSTRPATRSPRSPPTSPPRARQRYRSDPSG